LFTTAHKGAAYALDAGDRAHTRWRFQVEVVWDMNTAHEYTAVNGGTAHGGSMDAAGPAVVNGMVFAGSGYGQWGGMPGNVLLVFSVNGE
jgi:hypothetical protein